MSTAKAILDSMHVDSIDECTEVYLYRIYKDKFVEEKAFINLKKDSQVKPAFAFNRICGRIDDEGNLSKFSRIHALEGHVYSNGGTDSVWFLKASKRKAKKAIKEAYLKRIERAQKYLDRYNRVMKELK